MPTWGLSGGPQFGLRQVKLAPWNGDGTYDAAITVPAAQLFGIRFDTTNARLEGDDQRVDSHSKLVGATITIRNGSLSMSMLQAIMNRNPVLTGTTPTQRKVLWITPSEFGYVGVGAKVNSTNNRGDAQFFAPKVKLMEGFELRAEYGNYVIPEFTLDAVPDDFYNLAGSDEVQVLTITGSPTGGTFTLTFYGRTTTAIAYNAAASAVEDALEALPNIEPGDVTVTGSAGGPYTLTFGGNLANAPLQLIDADGSFTGGTAPDITPTRSTLGSEDEPAVATILENESASPLFVPPL